MSTIQKKKCSTSQSTPSLKAGAYLTSQTPTLVWRTYIPGGDLPGIGTTYGGGKVFTGSFLNQQSALDANSGAVIWK
jgi:outer membrane protein assembly factor BamB